MSKKGFIFFLSVCSIVAVGAIKDFHTRSIKFENPEAIEEEIIPVERSVASETGSRVAVMEVPISDLNKEKINSEWEITRIIDSDEKVVFDKLAHPEDAKKNSRVQMELIGTSLVQINRDKEQIFRISLLSDFGTIALFRKFGSGYEILEAKKIVAIKSNSSLVVSEEIELVLERALNQAKSNKVLEGNDVSGQVSLSAKSINGLAVELRNPNGETQNIEIDSAELKDGGTFKAEVNGEEVSGVVFNNGKDGYRISFVTGPVAGAMLNFVTKDQMERVEETQRDAQAENPDVADGNGVPPVENTNLIPINPPTAEGVQEGAEQVMEERRVVAEEVASNERQEPLSPDEVRATAEEKGFKF